MVAESPAATWLPHVPSACTQSWGWANNPSIRSFSLVCSYVMDGSLPECVGARDVPDGRQLSMIPAPRK